MAVITGRPPKRVRVTAGPRALDLRAFPATGEAPAPPPRGAFRDCMRAFLARSAVPADGAWRVAFRVGDGDGDGGGEGAVVAMEVVEEDVARAGAGRIYCEHCTVAGWSTHPVCGRRYHFIIRNEYDMHEYKTCKHCGHMAQLFETRCPSCKNGISYDDPEDWDYRKLDNPRHLLHGIVRLRRWSCGGVSRAAESGPAPRCPAGGGDGRRSCAAAACSRHVEAPLMGLLWSGRTTVMTVMDGKGPCFLARRFVLEDSLGESLATATSVGAALPVGGVVYPL